MAGNVDWTDPSAPALESLFVHTMAWGSGTTNGRGPRYTDQALASGAVPEVMATLGRHLSSDGAAAAQHSRIAAAYTLHPRLPGVGPAFFTKLLWVVGGAIACAPTPLALDARVWDALAKLGWNSVEAAGGTRNRGKRYVAYLLACQSWAEQATCSPEDIEYTLFWRR
jgi:Putative 8-oxoguanine DNA glycosylase OGG-like protein